MVRFRLGSRVLSLDNLGFKAVQQLQTLFQMGQGIGLKRNLQVVPACGVEIVVFDCQIMHR